MTLVVHTLCQPINQIDLHSNWHTYIWGEDKSWWEIPVAQTDSMLLVAQTEAIKKQSLEIMNLYKNL